MEGDCSIYSEYQYGRHRWMVDGLDDFIQFGGDDSSTEQNSRVIIWIEGKSQHLSSRGRSSASCAELELSSNPESWFNNHQKVLVHMTVADFELKRNLKESKTLRRSRTSRCS